MALDKVSAAMMSPLSVSETAPSNPAIGQRWYRASTAVTYQYTNDGTSSFWLDVSSGGIGTSASRGIDFVGDVDPIATTNGTGLAVGSVYYNRENNRHFVCTDNTTNANVWSGRFAATGGTVTSISGYKVHTFLTSGIFTLEEAKTVDYLIIAGGGSGGDDGGGGGGAGGYRTSVSGQTSGGGGSAESSLSLAAGGYVIHVGGGGIGQNGDRGNNGGDSFISHPNITDIISLGGGGGGRGVETAAVTPYSGGSGGGGGKNGNHTGGAGTSNQGYAGGNTGGGSTAGGGGGGAGYSGGVSGHGGSGIVILRYAV